jgi:hypothetical protein
MRIFVGLTLAISLSACATAPTLGPSVAAAPEGVQQASLEKADPGKPVCRMQPGFGGAPGQRICLTQQQWDTYDSRQTATNESMQNSLNARRAWVTGPVYTPPKN